MLSCVFLIDWLRAGRYRLYMATAIKTITVQTTERDRDVIRSEAHRYGMNHAAVVAAMVRLWKSADDAKRSAMLAHPIVDDIGAG